MDEALVKTLEENGYAHLREIPGHGVCALIPMMFTVGLACCCDKSGIAYRYCYESLSDAFNAIKTWDGINDPPGNWIKRKGRGGDYCNPNYQEQIKNGR